MKTKADIIRLITLMRSHWGTFAMTKEAFTSELSAYLYVFSDESASHFVYQLKPKGVGASTKFLLEKLNEEYARRACDLALSILA